MKDETIYLRHILVFIERIERHEYGRSILFDYSYRHFHEDGYGKDFSVLNLEKGYEGRRHRSCSSADYSSSTSSCGCSRITSWSTSHSTWSSRCGCSSVRLNMGRGEGPQVIQLFGRGVRLKGRIGRSSAAALGVERSRRRPGSWSLRR